MDVVVFDGVAKRYRIGMSQVTLPSLASTLVRSWVRRGVRVPDDGYLWALRDVDFRLGQGESLALVGPNGAGKTTILKLLANITKPTSGRVEVNGRISALIELGAGFHPELTGRDNVFLNGTILGIRRRELERRFDEIVDFSGVERFIDTPVKRYSSGMIVRLGFAVAACTEPDILLVDEVLAVGDAAFSQKCLARIQTMVQRGTTIVFVSHNLYLVKAVCQRSLYLKHGRVRLSGTTAEAIQAYERDLHDERAARLDRPGHPVAESREDLEITGIEVLGPDGTANPQALRSREPALLRITYSAFVDAGDLHMSVFIRRSDGLVCCMLRTSLDGVRLRVPRGQGSVTIRFEKLQLISGTYFAEAYFLNETDSMGLTSSARQSPWFSVTGAALSYEQDSGVFEPAVTWSHRHGAPGGTS